MKTKNIDKHLALLLTIIVIGLVYFYSKPKRVVLERVSRTGYFPTTYDTIPYNDSISVGDRIWYKGMMWTAKEIK